MSRFFAKYSALLLLAALPSLAMEPTLAPGSIRFKMSYQVEEAESYLGSSGESLSLGGRDQVADYSGSMAGLQLEWGWRRGATVVVSTRYEKRELEEAGEPTIETSDLGSSYLGLRQDLSVFNSPHRLLTELGVWIPSGYENNDPLPLGSGAADWQFLMGYAQDFHPIRGGFELDFGYRLRGGDPSDEYLFDTSVFFGLGRVLLGRVAYHVVESKDESRLRYNPLDYPVERGSQRLALELSFDFGQNWRVIAEYNEVVEGRSFYETDGLGLTLVWQR